MLRTIFGALLCTALTVSQGKADINLATMHSIRSNLDRRVSPCSNFWAFACGNWSSNYVDNFQLAEQRYANAMIAVLTSNRLRDAPRLFKQLQDYFTACVGHPEEQMQLPPELLSGEAFEWTRATARLRKYGLNGVFFDEMADVAYNDSLSYVVQLKMPVADNNHSPMRPETRLLERDLRILREKYGNEEPMLQLWMLSKLNKEIPQIEWEVYFQELLEREPGQLLVQISDVEYFRKLGELLRQSSNTAVESYLSERLAQFVKEAKPDSTLQSCIHHMSAVLPLGMNYIYDRYVYRTRSEDMRQLQQLFDSLRGTFAKYLEHNRLELSHEQLSYLHAKLAGMQLKLGNLPNLTSADYGFYNDHYASANFSAGSFAQSFWQALRLRTRLQHLPLGQPGATLQLKYYYVNDDLVRARNAPYFEHERNTLTVPLVFMQWPFYDHRQHPIFRHSLMGFILGHELSHAFEQEGILFDAAGNEALLGVRIRQKAKFQAALNCAQHSPTASLKERLADFNGLQLAYDTFFGLAHDSQRFEYRPYDFEQEFLAPQIFHLNFAQFFCGRLPTAINHDMDDVRVNEAELNLHQFSIDFSCTRHQFDSIGCEMWRAATHE
ncbi:PREDICTED: membrane metallo-endopeptidase-like 1 [Drosophila arizonae]|uniref:Membrane metallo-endopeptidase-like 1 n=1 Tax=Drosophila arizonae TaxID=7263 RepID=A0ABM1PBE5_DROAR|nr:PREDICTED: membrane metallo-endopeptidase-like 1 [Drosophila arizonae]